MNAVALRRAMVARKQEASKHGSREHGTGPSVAFKAMDGLTPLVQSVEELGLKMESSLGPDGTLTGAREERERSEVNRWGTKKAQPSSPSLASQQRAGA